MSGETDSDLPFWRVIGETAFPQTFSWGAGLTVKVELQRRDRAAGDRWGTFLLGLLQILLSAVFAR